MLSFHRMVHGLMVHRLRSFSTVLPRRAQEVKAWVDEVVLHHNFCFKAARFTCRKIWGSSFFYKFFKQKNGIQKDGAFQKRTVFEWMFFFSKVVGWRLGALEFS